MAAAAATCRECIQQRAAAARDNDGDTGATRGELKEGERKLPCGLTSSLLLYTAAQVSFEKVHTFAAEVGGSREPFARRLLYLFFFFSPIAYRYSYRNAEDARAERASLEDFPRRIFLSRAASLASCTNTIVAARCSPFCCETRVVYDAIARIPCAYTAHFSLSSLSLSLALAIIGIDTHASGSYMGSQSGGLLSEREVVIPRKPKICQWVFIICWPHVLLDAQICRINIVY